MARRLRLGPSSSRKVLGLVAVAGLVMALVLTGRALNGGRSPPASPTRTTTANTQAPYRIGANVNCPPLWPVLAMSNHASYPAGHPARPPPRAIAVACYQTAAQAASAGYPPAPLPPGALEVGGVYLTPPSRGFQASCQQFADRLGLAIPCPGLLPTPAPGTPPPRLCAELSLCRRGQLLTLREDAFVVPPGYVGAPGGFGMLSIDATPIHGGAGRPDLQCLNERRIATLTVHRTRAVLVACPEDPPSVLGGSVRLGWSEQGTLVVVTVLGSGEVNQRLAVVLADHLRLVRPGS